MYQKKNKNCLKKNNLIKKNKNFLKKKII